MATQTARPALRLRPRQVATKPREKRYLPWRIAGYVLLIGGWQLLSTYVFEPYILPAPTAIVEEMVETVQREDFWSNFLATLEHLFIGFAIAVALGTAIGILMGFGWLIGPFVTSIPRETLSMTLEAARRGLTMNP